MNESASKEKLRFLDGVRGVAAMIVVFHHFGLAFFPAINYLDINQTHLGNGVLEMTIARTPLNIFFNGGFAVSIFFILSGFVLSYKFHLTGDYTILRISAVKRYFRLLIPVCLIIIICYVLYFFRLYYIHDISGVTKSQEWSDSLFIGLGGVRDIIKNMFVDVFFNNDNRYNAVLWTMTIELLGSLLLFSFLALAPRKHKIWIHLLVALLIIFSGKIFYACFLLGSTLSFLYVKEFSFPPGIQGAALKILLLLAGIYFSSYPQGMYTQSTCWKYLEWSFVNSYELFHTLGAFCCMLVICFDRKLVTFFSFKPFLYLGKISFSFYLVHFPVLCSLGSYVFGLFISNGYAIAFLLAFTVSMLTSLIISHFYFLWVDKKGIGFSNKIGKIILGES